MVICCRELDLGEDLNDNRLNVAGEMVYYGENLCFSKVVYGLKV